MKIQYLFIYFAFILLISTIIVFILAIYRLNSKSWFLVKPFEYKDFHANAKVSKGIIPITYYEPGKLHQVLSKFHQENFHQGFLHVYRIQSNNTYKVNQNLFDFDIDVITTREYCDYAKSETSILCSLGCKNSDEQFKVHTNRDVLEVKDSKYYATFSEIKNSSVIEILLDSIGASHIFKDLLLEQAFISNFPVGWKTANLHAAQLVSSMAVQFIGRKTWLFFDANTYLNDMNPIPSWGSSYPTKSPDKPYKVYIYHSEPGDVLFFSDNYAHTVYTAKGPNVMINMRKMSFDNFWRQPINWLHGIMLYLKTNPLLLVSKDRVLFPDDDVNVKAAQVMSDLCWQNPEFHESGKVSDWDALMSKTLFDDIHAHYNIDINNYHDRSSIASSNIMMFEMDIDGANAFLQNPKTKIVDASIPYTKLNLNLIPNQEYHPLPREGISKLQWFIQQRDTTTDMQLKALIQRAFDTSGKYEIDKLSIPSDDSDYIKANILPPPLRNLDMEIQWQVFNCVELGEISQSCYLLPHRDSKRSTVINFYYKVQDEITMFFTNETYSIQLPGDTDKFYLAEWVTPYDSFQARTGDVFVLDVSQIHAVMDLKVNENRILLSIGFTESYEDLLNIMYEYIV